MKYFQVLINSENRQQAANILDHLLTERLVIGGPIFNGPAKFLWEGTLMDMDYCLIVTYSREDKKASLIEVAEKASTEKVCMISFLPLEGNAQLLKLIDDELSNPAGSAPRPEYQNRLPVVSWRAGHTTG
jgi:uncharacterized protein involved in tolerance to divalent cations